MGSISNVFGYILNFIYEIVKNYGVAIIIFSILLKILLLPLSIKQQKTMKKSAKIQGKVKEIQKKYKNNPEQMNKETMDLYKRENMSPFSGCIVSILQIVIILAMFYLVRSPLTFMKKVDSEKLTSYEYYIQETQETGFSVSYPEISIVKYVNSKIKEEKAAKIDIEKKNAEDIKTLREEQSKGKIENNQSNTIEEVGNVEQNNMADIVNEENTLNKTNEENEKISVNEKDLYINMNFLGLDLSNVPKENYKDITVYIIPLLYVITSIVSMKLTTKMTEISKQSKKNDVIIENGEKVKDENSEEMAAQMNKSMSLFLPVMSVMISLVAPLGLALYWLINNILMIVERILLNKFLKDEEE